VSTVVVTGGTRGIGLGLAKELLARGCNVAICGRSQESVDAALAALASDRATGVVADVTDEAAITALWDAAVAAFGSVDIWVNNAGISSSRAPIHEADPKVVRDVIETNLLGAIVGSRVALRGFLAQGRGALWNMEGFGSNGMTAPGMIPYGSSKRAVTYLSKALVKETKGLPVEVGRLSPGIVLTDLLFGDYEGEPEALEKAKKVFNILGDKVETVTPFLAERLLAHKGTGGHIQWLTRRKAAARFATAGFRKRDLMADLPS
jgi:NAD(P)-dependent dehydrogenase (short-subunit alcohol dehydrogenase family)